MTRLLLVCAAIAAGALPVAAQDTRLKTRLPASTVERVDAIVGEARADGLPVEPLVRKALEGASKNAAPDRIVDAVRSLAERLRTADSILEPGATEAELVSAAAALYAGVSPAGLRRVTRETGRGSLGLRLVVLTDLIHLGVVQDTAVNLITDLIAARVADDAYVSLRDQVRDDVRRGAAPGPASELRLRGILSARGG